MTVHSYRCEACGGAATWRPSAQQEMCRSRSTVVPLPWLDTGVRVRGQRELIALVWWVISMWTA
jgi:hypothetical protein